MFVHITGINGESCGYDSTEIIGYNYRPHKKEDNQSMDSIGTLKLYNKLGSNSLNHDGPFKELELTYENYIEFLSRMMSETQMIELGYKKKKNNSFR